MMYIKFAHLKFAYVVCLNVYVSFSNLDISGLLYAIPVDGLMLVSDLRSHGSMV